MIRVPCSIAHALLVTAAEVFSWSGAQELTCSGAERDRDITPHEGRSSESQRPHSSLVCVPQLTLTSCENDSLRPIMNETRAPQSPTIRWSRHSFLVRSRRNRSHHCHDTYLLGSDRSFWSLHKGFTRADKKHCKVSLFEKVWMTSE